MKSVPSAVDLHTHLTTAFLSALLCGLCDSAFRSFTGPGSSPMTDDRSPVITPMTPRPIHRTLLFWLGVPGLIFCLWAWIRSNFHGSVIIAQIPHRFFCQFTSAAGSLEYIFLTSEAGSAFGTLTYEQSSAIEPAWFPPAIVPTDPITDPFDAPEHYTLVAWWLITLVYTLFWTAAIFASRRRQRRLLENTPSLPS